MKIHSIILPCLAAVILLSGCAAQRPNYILPNAGAGATATVNLRATGIPAPVYFYISESEAICKEFSSLGYVFDQQRDKAPVMSAIEDVVRKITFFKKMEEVKVLSLALPAGRQIQLQGYGYYSDGNSIGKCGPITRLFKPEAQATYLVDFEWNDGQCSMSIQAEEQNKLRSVEAPTVMACRMNQ